MDLQILLLRCAVGFGVSIILIWFAVARRKVYAKLPASTVESWYENGWGTSYASYISPLVSTPLEGLKEWQGVQKYKRQFKGKKETETSQTFPGESVIFSDVIGTLPVVDYQIWRVLPCLVRVF